MTILSSVKRRLNTRKWMEKCTISAQNNLTNGNYVKATFKKNHLNIDFVQGSRCKPKPDGCNCKSLLEKVVQSYKTASQMNLVFSAKPPINGCRCYLGVAARNGFQRLDIEGCRDTIDFDNNNYSERCEALIKRADQCWKSIWYIKK